ncbi:MAG: RNA polymerase subunit sigma-24 [Limosilactobacillus sp.]
MTTKRLQDGFNFLYSDKRTRLIHGVLKGLGVAVTRDDYQDLFQEGCLIFAQVFADYPEDVTTPMEERRLMSYAYRKIRWRLLDILRHQQRGVNVRQYSLDQDELPPENRDLVDPQAQLPFNQLANAAFFTALWQRTGKQGRRYLQLALQDRFASDAAIAQHCGVSRQAVCQWKRQLIATARRLQKDWPDMV